MADQGEDPESAASTVGGTTAVRERFFPPGIGLILGFPALVDGLVPVRVPARLTLRVGLDAHMLFASAIVLRTTGERPGEGANSNKRQ